jgi:broad specificity phosphatase PhoE
MSPDEFIVIRHAMPELDPHVPPEEWRLGPAGREAARRLAPVLPTRAYLVSSDEPKAMDTLREAAGTADILTDCDLGEVRRPHEWLEADGHRQLAAAWLAGARHPGWESQIGVKMRFEEALERHAAAAATDRTTLVVCTHGMATSAWLAAWRLIPDAVTFHAALRWPDAYTINMRTGTVHHLDSTSRVEG